jgi:hypothetical protein
MTRDEQAELEAYREQQAREDAYMYAEWRAELEEKRLEEQREDELVADWDSRGEGYDEWSRNKIDEDAAAVRRDAEKMGF